MSAIPNTQFHPSKWRTIVLLALSFWLSGSLLLDLVIMPSMYVTGMMTSPGFATAGYSLFWVFNRIELICAAVALTGILVLQNSPTDSTAAFNLSHRWVLPLATVLLGVVLVFTYGLAPAMSAIGLQLNWFAPALEVPIQMDQLHSSYWVLELFKLTATGVLLGSYYQQDLGIAK